MIPDVSVPQIDIAIYGCNIHFAITSSIDSSKHRLLYLKESMPQDNKIHHGSTFYAGVVSHPAGISQITLVKSHHSGMDLKKQHLSDV